MGSLQIGWEDVLHHLHPDTLVGALVYLVLFVLVAMLLSRLLRVTVRGALVRRAHLDRTTMTFLQQVGVAAIWVAMCILYAHLIPVLRSLGTALLTGASIASVVIGLAAQSTLGNLIAGVAITLYRPFRLGDRLQVTAPTGTEVGSVEMLSLGYTTLRTEDDRLVVLPNSVAASQVVINLTAAAVRAAAPLSINIHVSREADLATARQLAVRSAQEALGSTSAVLGCFLTRMDDSGAALELRLHAPAGASEREALRSKLIEQLAAGFAASGLDRQDGQRAAFS